MQLARARKLDSLNHCKDLVDVTELSKRTRAIVIRIIGLRLNLSHTLA